MGDIIKLDRPSTYNLKPLQELYSRNPKTLSYGKETISFLDPKTLARVQQNIKNCAFLSSFKIETCWFYIKNYQNNNKFTENKDCYIVLTLTHFGSTFSESLGISVFWGTYNQVISFSISCRNAENIGFWWNVGSNWVNVNVSFISIFILYQ